jgi:hypothetical protein
MQPALHPPAPRAADAARTSASLLAGPGDHVRAGAGCNRAAVPLRADRLQAAAPDLCRGHQAAAGERLPRRGYRPDCQRLGCCVLGRAGVWWLGQACLVCAGALWQVLHPRSAIARSQLPAAHGSLSGSLRRTNLAATCCCCCRRRCRWTLWATSTPSWSARWARWSSSSTTPTSTSFTGGVVGWQCVWCVWQAGGLPHPALLACLGRRGRLGQCFPGPGPARSCLAATTRPSCTGGLSPPPPSRHAMHTRPDCSPRARAPEPGPLPPAGTRSASAPSTPCPALTTPTTATRTTCSYAARRSSRVGGPRGSSGPGALLPRSGRMLARRGRGPASLEATVCCGGCARAAQPRGASPLVAPASRQLVLPRERHAASRAVPATLASRRRRPWPWRHHPQVRSACTTRTCWWRAPTRAASRWRPSRAT